MVYRSETNKRPPTIRSNWREYQYIKVSMKIIKTNLRHRTIPKIEAEYDKGREYNISK